MKDVIYKYTFVVKDKEYANSLGNELMALKRDFPGFYFKHIETRKHAMFEITTDTPDLGGSEKFKKLLFRVGLKVEGGIKTRAR